MAKIAITDEEIDKAERRFLQRFASEITEHDILFLRGTPRELYLSLPALPIKQTPYVLLADINGPDELESEFSYCTAVCARTISSYPHLPGYRKREGDPICDAFRVKLYDTRVLVALADGCNWGTRPRDAARAASAAFIEYMERRSSEIISAADAGYFLLRAMSVANNNILQGRHPHDVGTTTLFGGMLFELEPDCVLFERSSSSLAAPATTTATTGATTPPSSSSTSTSANAPDYRAYTSHLAPPTDGGTASRTSSATTCTPRSPRLDDDWNPSHQFDAANDTQQRYLFACVNVGDCKAFVVCPNTQTINEVTRCNRSNAKDASDPGGRLGPYLDEGAPDLRNLQLFCYECKAGEFLVIMSDGVYDNLDPHHDGLAPSHLGLTGDTWDQVCDDEAEDVIGEYRIQCLKLLLFGEQADNASSLTPQRITNTLLHHAFDNTQSSRDFMASHPGKRLPDDYVRFPGKMDHTTCIAFQVGSSVLYEHQQQQIRMQQHLQQLQQLQQASSSSSSATIAPIQSQSQSQSQSQQQQQQQPPQQSPQQQSNSTDLADVKLWPSTSNNLLPSGSTLGSGSGAGALQFHTLAYEHNMALPVLLHVPLSVTIAEYETHMVLFCHTITTGEFSCLVDEVKVFLRVMPPSCLSMSEQYGGFSVFGVINELEQPIERAINLPCKVIPGSKLVKRDLASGIISIKLLKKTEQIDTVSLRLW
jgi:hypothetical protein